MGTTSHGDATKLNRLAVKVRPISDKGCVVHEQVSIRTPPGSIGQTSELFFDSLEVYICLFVPIHFLVDWPIQRALLDINS